MFTNYNICHTGMDCHMSHRPQLFSMLDARGYPKCTQYISARNVSAVFHRRCLTLVNIKNSGDMVTDVRVQYEGWRPVTYPCHLDAKQRFMHYDAPLEPHHTHFILQDARNLANDLRSKCE